MIRRARPDWALVKKVMVSPFLCSRRSGGLWLPEAAVPAEDLGAPGPTVLLCPIGADGAADGGGCTACSSVGLLGNGSG